MKKIYFQINSAIANSQHILLHLHPSPDAESVGSALAFYHYLKSIKKKVTLITGDSRLSPSLSHLPGAKKIITKNFFDLDLNKFYTRIDIITKTEFPQSRINQIENYLQNI